MWYVKRAVKMVSRMAGTVFHERNNHLETVSHRFLLYFEVFASEVNSTVGLCTTILSIYVDVLSFLTVDSCRITWRQQTLYAVQLLRRPWCLALLVVNGTLLLIHGKEHSSSNNVVHFKASMLLCMPICTLSSSHAPLPVTCLLSVARNDKFYLLAGITDTWWWLDSHTTR